MEGGKTKTKFELAIVQKVIAVRRAKGVSQEGIAAILNLSKGFIGQIESPQSPSKYNLNHLNRLAFELGCSPCEFIPNEPIEENDWDEVD